MITDPVRLKDVQSGWDTVRDARNIVAGNLNVISATGFPPGGAFRAISYNLLLLFAFSVLEDALKAIRDEGTITSKRDTLFQMMEASETVLPWRDFKRIDQAREDRNKVAHDRQYLRMDDALNCIAAIEEELVAWGIVTTTMPHLWNW
jgi:hypothetical protein